MKKIAVIGLGLIGVSLLKALQNKGHELYGVSQSPETIRKAIESGLVKDARCDFDFIEEMDVIFIATPIENVVETIENLKNTVKADAIIADLASVKGFIMDYVNGLDIRLDYIGLHPMAGTENKGFDSAVDGLFEGAKWAVIPAQFAKAQSIKFILDLIADLGSTTIMTTAPSHDRAVAIASHMPMIVAQGIFLSANDELTKYLAASGFRDMTRLAMTNSQMAKDMMKYNHDSIMQALQSLGQNLQMLTQNYQTMNLDDIAQQRKNMYSEEGKNQL
jgi:prephenate dehydrogenase